MDRRIDHKRLIDVITDRPAIWDSLIHTYNNDEAKQNAWNEVVEFFSRPDDTAATKRILEKRLRLDWYKIRIGLMNLLRRNLLSDMEMLSRLSTHHEHGRNSLSSKALLFFVRSIAKDYASSSSTVLNTNRSTRYVNAINSESMRNEILQFDTPPANTEVRSDPMLGAPINNQNVNQDAIPEGSSSAASAPNNTGRPEIGNTGAVPMPAEFQRELSHDEDMVELQQMIRERRLLRLQQRYDNLMQLINMRQARRRSPDYLRNDRQESVSNYLLGIRYSSLPNHARRAASHPNVIQRSPPSVYIRRMQGSNTRPTSTQTSLQLPVQAPLQPPTQPGSSLQASTTRSPTPPSLYNMPSDQNPFEF